MNYDAPNVAILVGDCIARMRELPDGFVRTCVTSPPYYGLRDYGVDGQIGAEETPEIYVARLVDVFREVHRLLVDDGTLWLNLGDSYARDNHVRADNSEHVEAGWKVNQSMRNAPLARTIGLKPKDLVGIPWMVAFALRADGWYLRQDIVWHKPNPMPESVKDRCTKAHEMVFLLAKSERYYFDADAIKEPTITGPRDPAKLTGKAKTDVTQTGGKTSVRLGVSYETKNKRDVWTVTPKPFKGAHFATMPPDLVEPCVLAGSTGGGRCA